MASKSLVIVMDTSTNSLEAPTPPEGSGRARSRATWLEIGAVVLLFTAPTFATLGSSLFWGVESRRSESHRHRATPPTASAFAAAEFESAVLRLRIVPIILFVMWRSGEGWSRFGLVKPRLVKDILLGLGLWLIVATLDGLIALAFARPHPWFGLAPTAVPWDRALPLLAQCCAVGFAEELEMRSYLIPRFEAVTGAAWKSLLLAVAVFGFVHVYKGYVGVIHSVAAAVVWGTAFCLTRRLWPVVIAHTLVDFIVGTHLGAGV